MSILIKGIDISKDDCNAIREITIENAYIDGHIQILVHDLQTGEFIGEAVEIPKHGRLIDADAFFENICNDINAMTKIGITVDGDWLWEKLDDALGHALTIIEAEE